MSEHDTEGRRYSHISQAWILEASWNDQEEIAYLRSQVADLTAKLAAAGRQWTNEQPRTPGWYWWKGRPDVCPDVHYVSEQDIAEGNPPGLWCGPLEAPR